MNTTRHFDPKPFPVEPWLYRRAIRLFGKNRLDAWKDQIAAYWEKNLEQIDEEQLLRALTRLYGKKVGRQLLRSSRSEKTQHILKAEEYYLVSRFARKLQRITKGPQDRFRTLGLKLEEHDYSQATVTHNGDTYDVQVDGLIAITGVVTAAHTDGTETTANVFSRWITHPFWQYAHQTMKKHPDETDYEAWYDQLRDGGLNHKQIRTIFQADELVKSGKVHNLDELVTAIGTGVVTEQLLRDTFFKN